jgi:hypothetical protein
MPALREGRPRLTAKNCVDNGYIAHAVPRNAVGAPSAGGGERTKLDTIADQHNIQIRKVLSKDNSSAKSMRFLARLGINNVSIPSSNDDYLMMIRMIENSVDARKPSLEIPNPSVICRALEPNHETFPESSTTVFRKGMCSRAIWGQATKNFKGAHRLICALIGRRSKGGLNPSISHIDASAILTKKRDDWLRQQDVDWHTVIILLCRNGAAAHCGLVSTLGHLICELGLYCVQLHLFLIR